MKALFGITRIVFDFGFFFVSGLLAISSSFMLNQCKHTPLIHRFARRFFKPFAGCAKVGKTMKYPGLETNIPHLINSKSLSL